MSTTSTTRGVNFGAGPAQLPLDVLEELQGSILTYGETGMSVVEISHRSAPYVKILTEAKEDLRTLLNVPSTHTILFMHGGGWGQFSAIPLNLLDASSSADYLVTGSWSKNASGEAKKFGSINIAANGESEGTYTAIPPAATWNLKEESKYLYFCDNETVHGVEFPAAPTGSKNLVADMSSNFLTRPIDFTNYAIVYAGAQKNCGIPGVTIVIVRNDLVLDNANVPAILDYKLVKSKNSAHNTPSVVATYVAGLMFKWIIKQGGIDAMETRSKAKSDLLYGYLDAHTTFYRPLVEKDSRSRVNVVFRLPSEDLEKQFVAAAASKGLYGLNGHRSVGGIRASLYNVQSVETVQLLVDFMEDFLVQHSK